MILDNQQQRELLIRIIENTQLGGTFKQLAVDISVLSELLKAVKNAEVENKREDEKSDQEGS